MRGQAHTLEAVTASLLLIGGLVFALQVTAVTPLSASTSSQHLENQHQSIAQGALATAAEQDEIRVAVLNWNTSSLTFYEVPNRTDDRDVYYTRQAPENEFGRIIDRSMEPRRIVYNVYVRYEAENGGKRAQRLVYRGEPSDNAVSATKTLVLFDDDVLYGKDESPLTTTLGGTAEFYAPDAHPSSGVYNVVEVEVIAWRQ
ncbi:DUF7288 family protein [Halorarius litoreus]|uniref:DUF7288 family protein n=1 Tax=Halorarius litoreus TaxID=2962676 RepID=UPI0020CED718|nr:hypothetical protein [Halorarius litoreus]